MSIQHVFLARHGMTVANETQVVQGFDDPLSEHGHAQAERLAKRAQHIPFVHLLASDMHRAQQTAGYVATATEKPIITELCLREVTRATSQIGISHASEEYKNFLVAERENITDLGWRFEDAENFADTRARSVKALECFEAYDDTPLFVVSHGLFIKFIIATVVMERNLTPELWGNFARTFHTHNTGITILRRDLETNHWSLTTVNDHAHFADD